MACHLLWGRTIMKTLKGIIIIFLGSSFLVGCMYGAVKVTRLNSLKKGMTRQEVISLLDNPVSTCQFNDIEYSLHSVWETVSDTLKGRTSTCYVKYKNGLVDDWGRNDINIQDVETNRRAIFEQSKIGKIEIRFLHFRDLTRWYKPDNKAMQNGYQLYNEELIDFVRNNLEKKGYLIKLGEPISITIPPDSPIGWGGWGNYGYYLAAQPFLKSLQRHDVDAIFLFSIPVLEDYGLSINCFIFDPKTKRLIYFSKTNESRRRVPDTKISESPLGGGKKLVTYSRGYFTESENEFLERSIRNLLVALPKSK